jgi:hypothetical protein
MSVQCEEDASQNSTCPIVTGFAELVTVAVRVTTVSAATLVTIDPSALAFSVVVVVAAAARACPLPNIVIKEDRRMALAQLQMAVVFTWRFLLERCQCSAALRALGDPGALPGEILTNAE